MMNYGINSIELFCGAGGLAIGLQRAGFNHHALYERDHDSCLNINANIASGLSMISGWDVHQTDVRAVVYDGMRGRINMVSGGPPCQPFSIGGKALAYKDHRDMFPEAVRAVREIHPEVFIFENVKGLLRQSFACYFNYIILQLTHPHVVREKGQTWQQHMSTLEQHHTSNSEAEYNIVYRLFNAADYGVPQLRHRVVIVGFRKDIDARWSFPLPTHSKERLLHSKWISGEYWEKHGIKMPVDNPLTIEKQKHLCKIIDGLPETSKFAWLTTRDAIGDMPDPRSAEAANYNNHEFRAGAKVYNGHSGSSLDEPSKTIKAGDHGVPGGENAVVLDNGEIRYYSVRESARIQTFPDEYRFFTSWTESMRQIGNAVPVKLAEAIGTSVYSQLMGNYHAR